jgi:8-oxo-dGTP diphosphatase
VQLFIFLVTQFSGSPTCIEGQLAMKWIHQNELNPDEFPEANREVMQLIPKQ